jgi:uncharacterized protein (DUF1697 family)
MPRYIAFLRAINVGGHTIKMDPLRRHFEALGLADVETFINSGNVAFVSKAAKAGSLEKKIEAHLLKALGYEVATFVRSAAELAAIAAYQPFPGAEPAGGTLYIAFAQMPPSREAQQKLAAAQTQSDQFHVHEREVYWLVQTRFSESLFSGSGKFEKMLGVPATVRNSTTVRKLAAKYPAAQQ